VVLIFNAHLVKCRLKYGLCNPPLSCYGTLEIVCVLLLLLLLLTCVVLCDYGRFDDKSQVSVKSLAMWHNTVT